MRIALPYIAFAAALGVVAWFTFGAAAHDAIPTASQPMGWSYGYECCSLTDCRTAAQSEIAETPEGYVYRPTNEVVPYGDTKRLKDSKDEDFHICTRGGARDGAVICLYRAPRGF